MQIIIKCWTPEWYDAVTHSVIPMDEKSIDHFLNLIQLANKLKLEDLEFSGLKYNRYDPVFIDVPVELVDEFDINEDDFDALCDDGYHVLPDKMDDYDWDEVGMRPCSLMVIAGDFEVGDDFKRTGKINDDSGRIYWYGYDKHAGSEGRIETYSLYKKDLIHIRKLLIKKHTTNTDCGVVTNEND